MSGDDHRAYQPHSKVGRGGADAQALLSALRVLAEEHAPRSQREAAARELLEQLRILAPGSAVSRLRLLCGGRRFDLWDELSDAIQHVALVASTGGARFRGEHPSEAVAWCSRVLTNHLVSELRRRRLCSPRVASEPEGSAAASNVGERTQGCSETRLLLKRLERDALEHLRRTRRASAVPSLYRAVCCYLEHISGAEPQDQLERWTGLTVSCRSIDVQRARNRLYRYHCRGKQVLTELWQGRELEPGVTTTG